MDHRLETEDRTLGDEVVAVGLDDFGAERRRDLTDVDLDTVADRGEVARVGRVDADGAVTIHAADLRNRRSTGDELRMEAAAAFVGRRLVDDHPDLIELEGVGVRGLEERVTTRGLFTLDDAVVVAGRCNTRDIDGLEEAARTGAEAFVLVEARVDEQVLLLDDGRLRSRKLVGGRLETILHLRHPLLHEHELLLDLVGGSHASREHDARDRRNDGDQIGTHLESLLLGCRTLHSNPARSRNSGAPSGVEGIVWAERPRDSVPEGAE